MQRDYAWETCAGASDTGCVGVIDGRKSLIMFTLFHLNCQQKIFYLHLSERKMYLHLCHRINCQ